MALAARISVVYLLIGGLWILFSDQLLQLIAGDRADLIRTMQTLKGWGFVFATSAILYLILRREFDQRAKIGAAARDREIKFRVLFAANPIPMWVYDRQTLTFLDVNEAACIHYGYSHDEFLSMRITDIRSEQEVSRLLEFLGQTNTGYRFAGEWQHITKEGDTIDVSTSSHTLAFAEHEAVLVAIQDITERKRIETERRENEEIRLMLTKETELRAIRNRFISMVSHEFRRPLTTITTSIELLEHYRSKMSEDAEQKHFARIHEQLDETKELLDDFLSLMRTEAAGQEFKPAPTNLSALCEKLIDDARISTEGSHQMRYEAGCTDVRLQADEKLLRHAIGNLLSNAVKYSPEGGEVRLHLWREVDNSIKISVSDQGMGIPDADQPQIFAPFYRASNVHEIGGSGLGLSITKQAIELHSGRLEIAKSDPTGTEFVITLPITEQTFLTGC